MFTSSIPKASQFERYGLLIAPTPFDSRSSELNGAGNRRLVIGYLSGHDFACTRTRIDWR